MIEQVRNFSQKSFVNYTGPSEKFVEVNILFLDITEGEKHL